MILILLALNLYFILVPVVIVVFVIASLISKNQKSKKRELLISEFRDAEFKSEDELAWFIAHDLMGKGGFPDCVVYKVDQKDQVCRQVAAYGPKNPDKMSILNPINIPFGRGIVGHVAANGKTEKIDDTTKDVRYVPDDDVRYSELTVPVLVDNKAAMVIDSEHKSPAWFKETDVEFMTNIALIAEEKLKTM